jgi:hypothetical protein
VQPSAAQRRTLRPVPEKVSDLGLSEAEALECRLELLRGHAAMSKAFLARRFFTKTF